MKAISFVKGLGWAVGLNILIKPIWIFGIDRQLQNEVGHEAYGAYFALLNLSIVFSFLADAGLSNWANIKLAGGALNSTKALLSLKIRLSAVYAVVVFLITAFSGIEQWSVLVLVVFIQVLTSFFVFLRSIITAHQLFTTDAFLSVLDKALMIFICGTLLYVPLFAPGISIVLFLTIQLGCTTIAVAIAAGIIINKRLLLQVTEEVQKIKDHLKGALPFALIILLMAALNRLDGFLLERLHPAGAYQAGIYASAYRLLDAGNMVGYLFASFLVPFIARHVQNKMLVEKTILTARHVLMVCGGVLTVFIAIYAEEVQELLYHFFTPFSGKVLQLCIAVLPAYLLLHVYGSLLTATLQLKTFLLILSACVMLNLLLNAMLIPEYGAAGCAVAALASQYLCAFCTTFAATKLYRIRFYWASVFVYLVITALLGVAFYAVKHWSAHPFISGAAIALFVSLLLFAYISFQKKNILLAR